MTPYRCPWYRRQDAAPVCPYPDDKGACVTCDLFPPAGRKTVLEVAYGAPDQQDEAFMAHYCPEAPED